MMDFHTHCVKTIMPMFAELYAIKASDPLKTVKHIIIFNTKDYLYNRDADIFGLELKYEIQNYYNEYTNSKPSRKRVDEMLARILGKIGDLLNANNRDFDYIANNVGRIRNHYTY